MIDVDRALSSLDIDFVSQRGDEVQGFCPMHKDRTGSEDHNPSWWINASTGVHFCFSCGYKGNIYTLVADLKGMDIFDAKEFLASSADLPVDVLMKRLKELPQYIPVEEAVPMSEARLAVFTDPPKDELRKRRITVEAAKLHGVLCDPTHRSWILPIRDPNNYTLWGWQEKGASGRFFKNQPTGVKKSKTVFGVEVMATDILVVVESPLDVPRLASAGVGGSIATYGAILNDEQAKIMRRSERVIAAFDKDEAGMKANEQMRIFARKYGLNLSYFNYSGIDAKDPGDMTLDQIHQGIETAKHMVEGKAAYAWH